jgi:hypothetical protein
MTLLKLMTTHLKANSMNKTLVSPILGSTSTYKAVKVKGEAEVVQQRLLKWVGI